MDLMPCGCSADKNRCGDCKYTQYTASTAELKENSELIENHRRSKLREKWFANRKISSERAHFPPGQFHYFDEYLETAMPSDFDEHYKCDNCQRNHIEEDCPSYRNHNPHAPLIKGKQRLGHIDTKREAIVNLKGAVIKANNELLTEDTNLQNGHKFCNCCATLVSPNQFNETVTSHPGKVEDIGEPHESYRFAVYGYTCCEQSEGVTGCCVHTHFFE